MPTYEVNGVDVEFQKTPTPADIDAAAQHISSKGASSDSSELQQAAANMYGDPNAAPQESPSALKELLPQLLRGVVQGGQSTLGTGVNAYELLSKLTGQTPNQAPRKFLEESKAGLDAGVLPGVATNDAQTALGAIAQGAGELPNMALQYENPAAKALGGIGTGAALGAINAQQGGAGNMALGAGEGAATLALLGKAQQLGVVPGAVAGGTIMGGGAALGGADTNHVIAQAALGAGFSLLDPTKMDKFRENVKAAQDLIKDPKERLQAFADELKVDPVVRVMDKINQKDADLKAQEAAVPYQMGVRQKEELAKMQGKSQEDIAIINSQKSEAQKKFEVERQKTLDERHAVASNLDHDMDVIETQVPEKAYDQAKYVQENFKPLFKQATDQYGEQLTKTAEAIDAQKPMSQSDSASILMNSAKDIVADYGSNNHPLLGKIEKLVNGKYSGGDPVAEFLKNNHQIATLVYNSSKLGTPEVVLDRILQSNPSLMKEFEATKNANKPVTFREFYSDAKKLIDSVPSDDHAGSILRKNLGSYIAKIDPSFQELQNEYSRIASYRSRIASIFKPWEGEAYREQGENWFKQFGLGKKGTVSYTDKSLLGFLEKGKSGNKLSVKGLGDISSDLKTMGEKLDIFKKSLADVKDRDYGQFGMKLADIAEAYNNKIQGLETQKKLTQDTLEVEMAKVKQNIEIEKSKALQALDTKRAMLKKNRDWVQKIDQSHKKMEGWANAVSMGLLASGHYHIGRLVHAGVMLKKVARVRGVKR